jgi:hypothetical protein
MAGSELTHGQAAEAIAAEGSRPDRRAPSRGPRRRALPGRRSDETRDVFADIDWTALAEASPTTWRGWRTAWKRSMRARSTSACVPCCAPCIASTGSWDGCYASSSTGASTV